MSIDLPARPSTTTDEVWLYSTHPDFLADGPLHDALDRPEIGKWLVFAPAREIDDLWAKISAATSAGLLGPMSKVSTASHKAERPGGAGGDYFVSCYVGPDKAAISEVLCGLRDLGISRQLFFKEDLATLLGQYGRGSTTYVSDPGSRTYHNVDGIA